MKTDVKMTYGEMIEAGLNPFEDVMVDSILYDSKKIYDSVFECCVLVQLVRLNCSSEVMEDVLGLMGCTYDFDEFDLIFNTHLTFMTDDFVPTDLSIDDSIFRCAEDLAERLHNQIFDMKFRISYARDLSPTPEHFSTICSRIGFDSESKYIKDALCFVENMQRE